MGHTMHLEDTTIVEEESTPSCGYIRYQNGIYQLTFFDVSRSAVDDYFMYLDKILSRSSNDETVYIVSDGSQVTETQPIGYMLAILRRTLRNHPHRPGVRVAIIYQTATFVSLINSLFRTFIMSRDGMRFFHVDNVDEAIAWLGLPQSENSE